MSIRRQAAQNLAAALLSGSWSSASMLDRATQAWGKKGRWLRKLVRQVSNQFPTAPDAYSLAQFIEGRLNFNPAWNQAIFEGHNPVARHYWVTPTMTPAAGVPSTWNVPAITTEDALVEWLGIDLTKLQWFADLRRRQSKEPTEQLHHYRYRWIAKRHGRFRLIEMPKPSMKQIQRRILDDILAYIPAHPNAHAYCRGRSIRSFAEPHVGKRIVVHLDLQNFFPTISQQRVFRIFTTAGYPEQVSRILAGLCTNATPRFIVRSPQWRLPYSVRRRLESAHLPQGAPTSPAVANLCAYRLDCRLTGLAKCFDAEYTRYADDLAFSGDRSFERAVKRFWIQAGIVALDEGFELNLRKTRFMRHGGRQQLAGVVVNERVNVKRREFDQLKAILHNCARYGLKSQNRNNHPSFRKYLAGRISYISMLNPARGEQLRKVFEKIKRS